VKVLLAFPPHPVPYPGRVEPLGVEYLAAAVSDRAEVGIFDGHGGRLSPADIVAGAGRFAPDVLGVSTPHNSQVPAALELIRGVRRILPATTIVWGGNWPTFAPERALADAPVDFVVRHEGESTFRHIVGALAAGRDPRRDPPPGLAFRDGGRVVNTGAPELVADLDSLPLPARPLVPGYPAPYTSYSIIASRGCPFRCPNCSTSEMWLHRRRQRSAAAVAAEIQGLFAAYGQRPVGFVDDLFTGKRRWVVELCAALLPLRAAGLTWHCNTRLDYLDAGLIAEMARAGCSSMFLGMESASIGVLRQLGKHYTPAGARAIFAACLEHGIEPNVSFMIGLPFETRADLEETVNFVVALCRDLPRVRVGVRHLTPLFGTRLHRESAAFGLNILDDDQSRLDLLVSRVTTRHLSRRDIDEAYMRMRIAIGRKHALDPGGA